MGEKDISEKVLFRYNDVFADIINVLVFNGERRVKENALEIANVMEQYKAEDGVLHEEERDLCKYWKDGDIRIALMGLENQSDVDWNMPIRVLDYDGTSYRSQLLAKPATVAPVMTLVLYFGIKSPWTSPRTVKQLLTIPDGLDDYVNDYRIHVVEVAWLTDEQVSMFTSDFGIVADFFVKKRKYGTNYKPSAKRIKHVDEVLKFLRVMTKDKRYEIRFSEEEQERGVSMCEIIDKYINDGRAEGVKKGALAVMLLREGKSDQYIIREAQISEEDLSAIKEMASAAV